MAQTALQAESAVKVAQAARWQELLVTLVTLVTLVAVARAVTAGSQPVVATAAVLELVATVA